MVMEEAGSRLDSRVVSALFAALDARSALRTVGSNGLPVETGRRALFAG